MIEEFDPVLLVLIFLVGRVNDEAISNQEKTDEETVSPSKRGWVRRHWMTVLTLIGCGITLSFWAAIKQLGDNTPYGTVLLFGPRWLYVLPWVLTGCLFLQVNRFAKAVFLITGWIAIFHVLMLNVPVRTLTAGQGEIIKILTCNLGPVNKDPKGLEGLIFSESPDVVMLQETIRNPTISWPDGWTHQQVGGLLIASRFPMTLRQDEPADPIGTKQKRPQAPVKHSMVLFVDIQTETTKICVATVHLPTPRKGLIEFLEEVDSNEEESTEVLEDEIEIRSRASKYVHDRVQGRGSVDIVAGDFNMLADSRIYRRDWSDYKNAFTYGGWGIGYTKFEKFEGHQVMGRIDHILVLAQHGVRRCWVGPHIGSDHRPLLAEVVLKSQ